ncbi:Dip2/Utp12 family-domain-containing protein [Sphaerosporella brunnea]|uniref:Dip2/Utp12 family-domain-containing protein n=1 Tax=Sphaerosporella brunnea TaxID=1250544 RepID=A0A5J5EKR2_9PEZI|nr:Dip2/Utp12 family-domain-containing protein [Sphaerosporella brunnea]
MVSKKSAAPKQKPQAASHLSSKLSTAASSSAVITASAFSPPALRLSLYASVALGLDAYRLRIHDTNTGRLRCEHSFEKGLQINSLSWGSLPPKEKKSAKKKRKKLSNGADAAEETAKNAVVAAATNKGTIILFSPSEGAVVGVLEGEHVAGVQCFVFSEEEGRGWSCGQDAKLVEWHIARKNSLSNIQLPDTSIRRLAPTAEKVLCASHTIYAIDKENPVTPQTFTAHSTLVHSLIASKDEESFLSAAETDRFINIFSLAKNKSLGSLVAESDVARISLLQGAQEDILAAVTAEGVVEVFKSPFEPIAADPAASRKKKALTRKGEAKIRIVRPNGKDTVSIADVSVHDEELILVWVEGGVNVVFERVRWANAEDGGLVLSGTVDITRSKTNAFAVNGAVMNGVKEVGKMAVDQSTAIVIGGDDMGDVGMEDAPEPAKEPEDEEEEEEETSPEDDEEDAQENGEASFADRFQALEVAAKPSGALPTVNNKTALEPPAANALTSVLVQALKTNDTTLLESCLHTTDSDIIMNTVRKLPSSLAVPLLERLAERLARKPGRAGSLGEWVRWTLVAHGGYLVTLPKLVRTLSGLYSTLNTRANALPRLLALQGRLDMLQAQVQLRQSFRAVAVQPEERPSEEAVVYVEGQTPESDSSDDESDQEPEEVGMEGMRIEDASYIKSPAAFDSSSDDESERGSSVEEGFMDSDDEEDDDIDSDEAEEDARAFLDVEASESEGEDDA